MKSEFGKGMCINLVKFAEHFENSLGIRRLWVFNKWINESPKNREDMLSNNPPSRLNYGSHCMEELKHFVNKTNKIYNKDYKRSLSKDIELFMNGASDHLYDIEVPKRKGWDKIRKLVTKLQKKGLLIGHGFTNKIWTIKDIGDLMNLTKRIALEIDKKLGLKGDVGKF